LITKLLLGVGDREVKKMAAGKKVVDTEYYELLGVPPDAPQDKIRRGYLRAARKWHPDKNLNNPEAEEKFKLVSDAYQVLSDEQLREVYDKHGKVGVNHSQQMAQVDPVEQLTEMCRTMFGCGNFDTFFGDPTTFPAFQMVVKMLTEQRDGDLEEEANAKMEDEEFQRKVKEKEEEEIKALVEVLENKVKPFSKNPEQREQFLEMVNYEATHLSELPGGDELLGVIGYVYNQEAKQHLNRYFGVEKILSEIAEQGHSISTTFGLLTSGIKFLHTSSALQRQLEEEESASQAALREKQNAPPPPPTRQNVSARQASSQAASPPPPPERATASARDLEDMSVKELKEKLREENIDFSHCIEKDELIPLLRSTGKYPEKATAGERSTDGGDDTVAEGLTGEEYEAAIKKRKLFERIVSEGLSILWKLGKKLVEDRVREVCERVMSNHDVSEAVREQRTMAILEMGAIYENVSAQMMKRHAREDAVEGMSSKLGMGAEQPPSPDDKPATS